MPRLVRCMRSSWVATGSSVTRFGAEPTSLDASISEWNDESQTFWYHVIY